MPTLQSSGPIALSDINVVAGSDEDEPNASLKTYSDLAASLPSSQRKEMTVGAPYALSEFYNLSI